MNQTAADKPNGCKVELSPEYPGSMSACGAAQWVKLIESWPKLKFVDFHQMLKLLLPRAKEIPREREYAFYDNWGGFVFGVGKQTEPFGGSLILDDRNVG
jgi:hypothetical protein